MILITIVLLS